MGRPILAFPNVLTDVTLFAHAPRIGGILRSSQGLHHAFAVELVMERLVAIVFEAVVSDSSVPTWAMFLPPPAIWFCGVVSLDVLDPFVFGISGGA